MANNWLTYLITAATLKICGRDRRVFGLPGHVIIGRRKEGYMTGQKLASQRPVYRARYDGGSGIYRPHQGAQECARRVRQGLAG